MPERSGTLVSRAGLGIAIAVSGLVALLAGVFLFGNAMGRGLSHDEQQHIAAGVLIAREGLLPYRDFPCLHTPYLPLIYSRFIGWSDYLLFTTRVFSALCATLIAMALYAVAFFSFAGRPMGWRLVLATGAVLLLLTSPVFAFTIGHSSNHELSILFALLGTIVHLAGARSSRNWPFFISGLLLSLAIGTRITFAPLVAPFLGALFVFPRASDSRVPWLRIALFGAGGVLGALPMLWLLAQAPTRFLYDVFLFSRTNVDYRFASGNPQNMTLLPKLRFLFKEVIATDLAVVSAALVPLGVYLWQSCRVGRRWSTDLLFLLAIVPFLLIGSLAPSPAFKQYFGALVPFLLLVGILCGSRIRMVPRMVIPGTIFGVAAVGMAATFAWSDYQEMSKLGDIREWIPLKRHEEALKLRQYTKGPILTLAPLPVLEANLKIMPEFVTGPFAWRVADFIADDKRRLLGIVGSKDLDRYLKARPVPAILLGQEKRWEDALTGYAASHGYRKQLIYDEGKAVWLKSTVRGHRSE